MIAKTSGSGILVFTRDSAFLYSVRKWTVSVTSVFIWWRCFHCYKVCLRSHNLWSQGPGSWISGPDFPGSQVTGFRVLGLRSLCLKS